MVAKKRTPTTSQMRYRWFQRGGDELEFDRWLEAHDQEVRDQVLRSAPKAEALAMAWDEGLDAFEAAHKRDHSEPWGLLPDNPYRAALSHG